MSITRVWGLETCWGARQLLAEEVVEEDWKLLLTHCPCLRPKVETETRPSLHNCHFEACHGINLSHPSQQYMFLPNEPYFQAAYILVPRTATMEKIYSA